MHLDDAYPVSRGGENVIRGIYTAATGMVAEMNRQNVIANNLANADTVGFKTDNTVSVPFEELLINAYRKQEVQPIGKLGLGVFATGEYADFNDGSTIDTGNATDLAIQGEALFTVATPNGTRYTRAGNFQLDRDGYLITKDGFRVLGEKGPIQVNGKFSVSRTGEVSTGGAVIDKLRFARTAGMTKEGENLYTATNAVSATNYQVVQGSLEHSNVNTIRQMVEMITVSRSYDANQRALTAHDETLAKAVVELAK
jgi:flagellar basal-body rod protein FlgG